MFSRYMATTSIARPSQYCGDAMDMVLQARRGKNRGQMLDGRSGGLSQKLGDLFVGREAQIQ